MKAIFTTSFRVATVALTLFITSSVLWSKETILPDPAARLLTGTGILPVQAAGPYVERDTLRIQVSVKLGAPTTVLPDGTWLYSHYEVKDSNATGTLAVRFNANGYVSEL